MYREYVFSLDPIENYGEDCCDLCTIAENLDKGMILSECDQSEVFHEIDLIDQWELLLNHIPSFGNRNVTTPWMFGVNELIHLSISKGISIKDIESVIGSDIVFAFGCD